MGKFLDKIKGRVKHGQEVGKRFAQNNSKQFQKKEKKREHHDKPINDIAGGYEEDDHDNSPEEDFDNEFDNEFNNNQGYDEVGIQPAQKPESFHHFILENQYKDLERSIRGLKDVWDKDTQKWKTKRKDIHCFTDEEAEDILRTTQSHLATDIKLGWIRKDVFGDYMDALFKEIAFMFESIAEYRYGRYKNFSSQYDMKLQNQKIFLELWTRIQANYSRSVEGQENKATHNSVRGQESLQSGERDYTGNNRGYS